jgi:ABC-type branched-chain amino acid transport systems, periplasmic component
MSGNDYDLEFIINEIDTFYLPGHFSSLFGSLKRTISEQNKQPITIAVLLPLSGLEKNQGLSYLLGLSEFLNQSNIDKSIRFLVFDTMGLVTNTLGIINHLSSNPDVIAILGPLTRDEVIALSGIKLQLPILIPKIELSGIADIADHLFFLSPSAEVIAKRTAEIIIKELNLERIAILSPGNGQIKSLTDHFINECRQLGIDPVAIEWYIEKPEDISRQLKNIRSMAWDLVPEDEKEDFTLNLEIDSLDALFDVDVNDFFGVAF